MHEVSLVRSLIQQVETIATDNGGSKVTEVRVLIGPLSGVEPMLVRSAFDQLAPTSQIADAKLRIDCTELEAICRDCGESFIVKSYRFQCSGCQSPSVRITSGDEFRLVSLVVEDDPKACLNKVSTK